MSLTDDSSASAFPFFDDLLYVILLIVSVLLGFVIPNSKNEYQKKQWCCTFVGLLASIILSGRYILHPVILTCVNSLIILHVNKRFCHVISFCFCFGYLILLRSAMHVGISLSSEFTNTILMIMTLKMVGLAYEVNIMFLENQSNDDKFAANSLSEATFCDYFHYSFCYVGILVGPYYKYETYVDFLHSTYSSHVPCFNYLKRRISIVPVYALLFLLSNYLFPCALASSDELMEKPFVLRVFYMTPWFFSFRMRMYVAFILGECICINVGFGAYPNVCAPLPGAGPSDRPALQKLTTEDLKSAEYSFKTIQCMDEYASEFGYTMRDGVRFWNLSVQYWLAVYIYKKIAASKSVKIVATMFVSAIWHGVRLGYYLSLLGTPLLLIVEMKTKHALGETFNTAIFKVFWYFVKMQLLAYMGVAFMLHNVNDTVRYWKSTYFFGHVVIVFIFGLVVLKNKFHKNHVQQHED